MATELINFTKRIIEALPLPATKHVYYRDAKIRGLQLRVTSTGVKTWVLYRKIKRNSPRITIGRYPDLHPEAARREATILNAVIASGRDPVAEKLAERAAIAEKRARARRRENYTVQALLLAYCDNLKAKGKLSEKSVRQSLNYHLLGTESKFKKPAVAARPIASRAASEITAKEWAAEIRRISTGSKRVGHLIRAYVHAAYALAVKAELSADATATTEMIGFEITSNPISAIDASSGLSGKRDRTLLPEEMQAYLLPIVASDDLEDRALELMLMAGGQRPRQMLRVPVAAVNLREATMLLYDPKGRRTLARPHLVPLGPRALEIATALVERAKKLSSPYVFSITGKCQLRSEKLTRRLAEIRTTMEKEGKVLGGHFVLKDVRRTVETYLAGLSIPKEIRAHLLSHGLSGVQLKHYDMYDYLAEKRDAVLRLERQLTQIEGGDFGSPKVVPLARRSLVA